MNTISNTIKRITKTRLFREGLPFLILIIGGSFGLREFASVRYEFRTDKYLKREELKGKGINIKTKDELGTTEEIHEEFQADVKKLGENWRNVRGPRLDEDNKDFHQRMKEVDEMFKKDRAS